MSVILEKGFVSASEFIPGGKWFNSKPLTLKELRGKVVLVDFMSYSCINCIRTFPYLNRWYEKYKGKGFEIVGVHSPEFDFEKNPLNLENAIKRYGLKFPIMQDNNYATWHAYDNHYWPAKYFVDGNGKIRWIHYGEGSYDESEMVIQELLKEAGANIDGILVENPPYIIEAQTPELYLRYLRVSYLASPEEVVPDKLSIYTTPDELLLNTFAFLGKWTVKEHHAQPTHGSMLLLHFNAKEVYLVMRPQKELGQVKVLLDHEQVKENAAGEDVDAGIVPVTEDRLYNLIRLTKADNHLLQLEFLDDNLEVFAFTFG